MNGGDDMNQGDDTNGGDGMFDGIDPANLAWRKSSYSDSGGACVETAVLPGRRVAVRHSKQPGGATLLYTPAEWDAFLKGAKDGEFDIG
jgi:Domain of unknown function (DUF397)